MDRTVTSVSAVVTASFTFHLPDFKEGALSETSGSLESLKSRWPLILEDFSSDVRLLIGRGQGEQELYRQMLVVDG